MSRSQKGGKQCGTDFGAKYRCDRRYNAGTGRGPKDQANSERRNEGKKITRKETDCL